MLTFQFDDLMKLQRAIFKIFLSKCDREHDF